MCLLTQAQGLPILAGAVRTLLLLAAGAATAAAQTTPLVRTEGWRHLFDPGSIDPGIGVVAFGAPQGPAWSDTLPLYARPGARQPIGRFLFASDGAGGWGYAIEWPESLTTNLLEYGYEEAGLPFDSLSPDERWARVIPGFTRGGSAVVAWAPVSELVTIVRWREHLAEHDVFFRDGVSPAFYEAPDGRPVAFPLPDTSDYILHPLAIRGTWMRVRAVTPSDMCADPEAPTQAELWIRFLDPSGRPLVWYHTRGC